MKKSYFLGMLILTCLVGLSSCKTDVKNDEKKEEKPTLKVLENSITEMKDSLALMQKKGQKIKSLHRIELINRLVNVYRNYPKSDLAADCLFETHMIYSAMEAPGYSSAYADTLLNEFPKYKNRALVLESQGANYDLFINPRDSSKVRFYYSTLLKEYPNLPKDKKEGIIKRLKYNHLTFDEYIDKIQLEM